MVPIWPLTKLMALLPDRVTVPVNTPAWPKPAAPVVTLSSAWAPEAPVRLMFPVLKRAPVLRRSAAESVELPIFSAPALRSALRFSVVPPEPAMSSIATWPAS